jgi:hypothetical protein
MAAVVSRRSIDAALLKGQGRGGTDLGVTIIIVVVVVAMGVVVERDNIERGVVVNSCFTYDVECADCIGVGAFRGFE